MIGAITGDIIGSPYEFNNIKYKDFPLFSDKCKFTDDTVLTIATADCIMNNGKFSDYYRKWGSKYMEDGYGGRFQGWLVSPKQSAYHSWGNGSAMRVSPVAWAYNTIEDVLIGAKRSAECTHNHAEGIKGAQATALAVFLARTQAPKERIKYEIKTRFGYDLSRKIDDIRPDYRFYVSCQKSVPESIISFLEANSYEETIRNAVSLGGDSDTMGAIAGSIAEAYYSIPNQILTESLKRLPKEMIDIIEVFYQRYVK